MFRIVREVPETQCEVPVCEPTTSRRESVQIIYSDVHERDGMILKIKENPKKNVRLEYLTSVGVYRIYKS